ncbi:hypothetical cytosolic protein [Syntrophus aciditrophicus SB]|uniref:Hypothetical cytosolic protein n=1 Tax=Syntrophus aciditrophicus (strain SB) TaxID=56780 RepID=Q2LQ71_SYNAS|nr:hypothetical cytosolic protein [Syntrophus aciditrophicus SB]
MHSYFSSSSACIYGFDPEIVSACRSGSREFRLEMSYAMYETSKIKNLLIELLRNSPAIIHAAGATQLDYSNSFNDLQLFQRNHQF